MSRKTSNLPPLRPSKPSQVQQSTIMPKRPKLGLQTGTRQSMSPKLLKAKQRQNPEVQEAEFKKALEELKEEESKLITKEDVKMEWLDHCEELDKQLKDNILESQLSKTNTTTIIDNATKDIELDAEEDDESLELVEAISGAAFDALHSNLQQDLDVLHRRQALIAEMMNEMQLHSASDYTADLTYDNDDIDFASEEEDEKPPMPNRRGGRQPALRGIPKLSKR